ncbi:MAG: 3-isopropylmalate dehydratase small subunit [Spirochaetales bacterium]|nr:3-isopropylmalate dehydratase small subunit [Spirochaetales bacterium]
MKISGKVFKFGNNIDTDIIIPTKYLVLPSLDEMARHIFEPLRGENFSAQLSPGDVITAGKNFGCGSSREQAVQCITACGVKLVIAESFSRLFFRNCINNGIYVIQSPSIPGMLSERDQVEIDINACEVKNITSGITAKFEPLSDFLYEIVQSGNLIDYFKTRKSW